MDFKEIELHRKNSYEINLNHDDKKLNKDDIFNNNDLIPENENDSHPNFLSKKKGIFSISKKMQNFCFVLFLLIFFFAINVSLLVLSKSRSSSISFPLDTVNKTTNSSINDINKTNSKNNEENLENKTINNETFSEIMKMELNILEASSFKSIKLLLTQMKNSNILALSLF